MTVAASQSPASTPGHRPLIALLRIGLPMNTHTLATPTRLADRALREHTHSLLRHLQDCKRERSRWYELACWGEALHEVVAPRFVTTVAAAGLLLLISTWWA
jgi:hypothetical protein